MGNDPLPDISWFTQKQPFFHIKRGNSLLHKKTRTESEYDRLPSINTIGSHAAGTIRHPMSLHRTNRWVPAGIAAGSCERDPGQSLSGSCQEEQWFTHEPAPSPDSAASAHCRDDIFGVIVRNFLVIRWLYFKGVNTEGLSFQESW
jgi:hypothetical protein